MRNIIYTQCAFCNGKGIDPFELLSPISICLVCNGAGGVYVSKPVINCHYCQGTGQQPHQRMYCVVCHGKGKITFLKDGHKSCPSCSGRGKEVVSEMPCLLCRGIGFVKKQISHTQERKMKHQTL